MAATQERADLVLGLFDQYYERVYAFLRKSTTPDVAEDLAQEVFLRLLQHPELERLTISISYLLKIAHNLLRRRYARATRLRELLEERSAGQSEFGDDQSPAATGTLGDAVLETALGLLSKDEQDAIRLIVCEGKSYQHAAEALGVSVTTINNWKHRGIMKLRKLISDPNDPSLVDPAATRETRAVSGRFGRETEIETFGTDLRTPRTRPSHGARGSIAWRAEEDAA